jgi:hypothetical protein
VDRWRVELRTCAVFNLTSPDLSLIDRTLAFFSRWIAGSVTDRRVILNLVQLMDYEPLEYSTSYTQRPASLMNPPSDPYHTNHGNFIYTEYTSLADIKHLLAFDCVQPEPKRGPKAR